MKRTLLTVAVVGTVLLAGCAVGKGPSGEIIMGVEVAVIPETVSEIGGALASTFLGPQAGGIVASVLATILGTTGIGIAGSKMASREKARKRADQTREKSDKEVAVLRAIVQMFQTKSIPAVEVEEDPVDPSS